MDLFCALFGHWPVPLASRRRAGRTINRCWMCDDSLAHADGRWQADLAGDARP